MAAVITISALDQSVDREWANGNWTEVIEQIAKYTDFLPIVVRYER